MGNLQQLLAFPPDPSFGHLLNDLEYDGQARQVVQALRDTSSTRLTSPVSGNDTILDIANPATHPLPYLFTLLAHCDDKNGPLRIGTKIWRKVLDFVSVFDPIQVRYAGAEFRKLLEAIERCASQDPIMAIEPLKLAILRLDPSGATLTSSHLSFLRLCLRSRAYVLATPILDNDIYHVPTPSVKNFEREPVNIPPPCSTAHLTSSTYITTVSGHSSKLDYRDHLTYFLYGAMIYIGLWNWERALAFLEIAISAPCSMAHCSMIQVEAYRKWVLVSILHRGKSPQMPRNVTNQTAKHLHALSKAYDNLAATFKEPDSVKLRAEIEAGPFMHDSNYALALLVLSAHQRFKVLALSETYTSLPLSQAASLAFPEGTSLEYTEGYVQNLIANSQLPGASLFTKPATSENPSPQPYLRFSSTTSQVRSEKELHKELLGQRGKVSTLASHMKDTQRKLELSKEYVEAIRKARKADAKTQTQNSSDPTRQVDDDMVADM